MLSKELYFLAVGACLHHGAMNTSETTADTLAQQLARLTALWVLRQAAPHIPLEHAGAVLAAWCEKTPMELALLPDAERILHAATQELVRTVRSTAQGRQALHDIGLVQYAKSTESTWVS